ncbi:MAG: cupin domain-containing protein [Pseudomonadales bacterium]
MPMISLGDISPEEFLRDYWQQKPLLIRGAFPNWEDPLEPDELAGLACEEYIESRIITGKEHHGNWTLEHGPIDESRFNDIGDKDWTLLVQAVDHIVPEVAALRQAFRFIPDWRIDDVMVSFAATGGSVGPHYDQYDVFLIQGQGQRRWQTGQICDEQSACLPHPDIRLLSNFTIEQEWVLEAGDMLYLPPGISHWGVAQSPCLTYSVGFRAPSQSDLLSHFADEAILHSNDSKRYGDTGMAIQANPGEITPLALGKTKALLKELIDDEKLLADWFGRFMTEPKYPDPTDELPTIEDLLTDLENGESWFVPGSARLAFSQLEQLTLFANGESISSEHPVWSSFAQQLCLSHTITPEQISEARSLQDVLTQLIQANCLLP